MRANPGKFLAVLFLLGSLAALDAESLVSPCTDDAARYRCGSWSLGAYYSVSPEGDWFGGVSVGAEYYFLPRASLGTSLSPGFGDGYVYLAPSFDANYYFWQYNSFELVLGYSFRYFYDWPLRKGDAQSEGTFHGPGISVMYGFTDELYAGGNLSYQWIRFGGEAYREWYFTLPLFYVL